MCPWRIQTSVLFGFVEHKSCCQVILTMQILLATSWEWMSKFPLVLFGGDILSAFDYMHPVCVAEAQRRRRYHPRISAAYAQEFLNLVVKPRFPHCLDIDSTPWSRCERQGSTCAARKWSDLLSAVFAPLEYKWESLAFGVVLGTTPISHLI